MPDLALLEGGQCSSLGIVGVSVQGTNVAGPSTANTKGAWTQLVAATAHEAAWATVKIRVSAGQQCLVDIGIGPSGSEVVLIPNLYLDAVSTAAHNQIILPLMIPNGVRVAARCQSSVAFAAVNVAVTIVAPTFKSGVGFGMVMDHGTNTATSGATSVDPGATANTKGAWVQITAATTYPIKWLAMVVGHVATAIGSTVNWLIDIGVGAAGSEQVIWANQHVIGGSGSERPSPDVICFPAQIPAGSRLAMRAQCSSTTAADRVFDCAIYGVA